MAIVGSREVTDDDLAFASDLGDGAAAQATCVVSGGASGADQAAMLGALRVEGCAVGVLADRLLRAATSTTFRPFIMSEKLALISPFNPEAGFDVGNAMARNKYIYCMADAAVVVASLRGKGGTWHGALENLKHTWVPLWIRPTADATSGAAALVDKGARWLPDGEVEFAALADRTDAPVQPELF